MKRVCPDCHYIGAGRHKGTLIGGILGAGLAIIMFGLMYRESILISIFISIIILVVAAIAIRNYYRVGKICPVCKYKDIPSINEPRGQEIINKNGLTIEVYISRIP